MTEETRKRLNEAAEKYADEYVVGDAAIIVDLIHNVAEGCFIAGAEWMFKECGGMTVLHDMRRLILAQCKAWLKNNAQPKYIFIEDGQPWIVNARLLADFEADMNKLWEGEK